MFKLFGHLNPIMGYLSPMKVLYEGEGGAGSGGGAEGGEGGAGGGEGGAGGGAAGGAGGGESWISSLPDNLKGNPLFGKYKSANEALAAFVDVQKLIGPEKIIIPSKDAKIEEWHERVFNRLGRPEKAEGYALPTDLEIPKELPLSEKLVQSFRETAHGLGILPQQFNGLYKWFMGEQISQYKDLITAKQESAKNATTELRKEWGAAFDQNLALGEKVLNSFADEKTIGFIKENGLNLDPAFVKFLHKVGSVLSEDQLTGKPPSLTLTPEEALAQIREMESDKKHPLFDKLHPEHAAAVKKRDALYRQAHPAG